MRSLSGNSKKTAKKSMAMVDARVAAGVDYDRVATRRVWTRPE